MDYRHEWKIALAPGDLAVLRQRLQTVMQPDVHAVDGRYGIRSLYFDTPEDRALREKLDGVSRREKFRIRYYNGDRSFIQLEKKCKCAGLGRKEQTQLSEAQARSIAAGRFDAVEAGADALLGEFCRKARAERPAGSGRRSARRCCSRRSCLRRSIGSKTERVLCRTAYRRPLLREGLLFYADFTFVRFCILRAGGMLITVDRKSKK